MQLKGVKNIIFDLGGVLLNIDFNLTKQAFIKLGVNDFDKYHSHANQERIIDAWNAMLLDFPIKRKELLTKLKQKFTLFALSNTNETHLKAFHKIIQKNINETSLNNLFHKHYFSNEIGYRKPDSQAFKFVLKDSGINPSETLFIDDTLENILAAKKLNFKTYHLNLQQNNNILNFFNEH